MKLISRAARHILSTGIAAKIFFLIGISTFMVIADNLIEIETHARRCRFDKEVQLEQLVEATHSLLGYYYQQSVDGHSDTETAQRDAIQAIRNLRFANNEYFWIHDQGVPAPKMILHPISPELESTELDDMQISKFIAIRSGSEGKYTRVRSQNLFVAMNELATRSEAGFIEYDWPKPLSDGMATETAFPKLSYIKLFKPWGWVIGTGIYIDELDTMIREDLRVQIIESCMWLLVLGLFIWMVIRGIIQPLKLFQNSIDTLRSDHEADVNFPATQPEELVSLADSFKALFGELKESRKGLRVTIENLRVLHRAMENMSEGVFITDPKGCLVWINSAFEKICGCTREEILGKKPGMLYFGKDDQELYRQIWRIVHTTDSWSGEVSTVDRNALICIQHVSIAAVKDEQDTLINYVGVVLDITERKRIENALVKSEKYLRCLFENMGEGFTYNESIIGEDGTISDFRILDTNKAYDLMAGLKHEDAVGTTMGQLLPHEFQQLKDAYETVVYTGKPRSIEFFSETLYGYFRVHVFSFQEGCFALLFDDITAEKRLIEKIRFLAELSDVSPALISVHDYKGRYLYANKKTFEVHGYSEEEFLDLTLEDVSVPETASLIAARLQKLKETGETVFQVEHFKKDKTVIPLEVIVKKIKWDGKESFLSIGMDISERKKIEEKLRQNLEVNRNLLRELHHRVKNNLTIISSMLSLQSFEIETPDQAFDGFRKSTDRISAMAMVHEDLYKSDEFSYVEMSDYLSRLSKKLLVAYGSSSGSVEIFSQAESVLLNVNASIPCGIIMNELITNAFKHAFPGGRKGKINVDFRKENDGHFVLSISDDGIGYASGSGTAAPKTLGMTLVHVLVEQLKGTYEIDHSGGTCHRIRFPQIQEPYLEVC